MKSLKRVIKLKSGNLEVTQIRRIFLNLYIKDLFNEEEPPKLIEESFRTNTCIICLDKEPNILFTDCNHICMCLECTKIKSLDNCPYCRTEISKRIKI